MGLLLNESKTKFANQQDNTITINDMNIETIDELTYLGAVVRQKSRGVLSLPADPSKVKQTFTVKVDKSKKTFERKVLRMIFGATQELWIEMWL